MFLVCKIDDMYMLPLKCFMNSEKTNLTVLNLEGMVGSLPDQNQFYHIV